MTQDPNNLILFPKTLDYYQFELTAMLEQERYAEAIRLLRFLLRCQTEDSRLLQEWTALLEWLEAGGFTGLDDSSDLAEPTDSEDEPDEDERVLLRQHLAERTRQDKGYAGKLLEELKAGTLERQFIALDQLALIADRETAANLIQWLTQSRAHPFVRFRILQIAAQAGLHGTLTLPLPNELITVELERTPVLFDQFPQPVREVHVRVEAQTGVSDATAAYFAEQTWRQFLAFSYGTNLYRSLSEMTDAEIDCWAAALHGTVVKALTGEPPNGSELRDMYGITPEFKQYREEAAARLAEFFDSALGSPS